MIKKYKEACKNKKIDVGKQLIFQYTRSCLQNFTYKGEYFFGPGFGGYFHEIVNVAVGFMGNNLW